MSPDFYGSFDFGDIGVDSGAIAAFFVVYFALWLFLMAYSIMVYIFQALGYYTIANRRGIKHPWLAWLPVANMWVLGSIADQYRYVAKGQVKNRRKTLLGLNIAIMVGFLGIIGGMIALLVTAVANGFVESAVIAPAIVLVICYVVIIVLAIILMVYQYICLYDLYASCNPNNAVVFLVLGIFFNFLTPYFVFASRKKDLGMPPRKVQVPVAPWQPVAAVEQPQWQNPELPVEAAADEPAEAPVEEPTEE